MGHGHYYLALRTRSSAVRERAREPADQVAALALAIADTEQCLAATLECVTAERGRTERLRPGPAAHRSGSSITAHTLSRRPRRVLIPSGAPSSDSRQAKVPAAAQQAAFPPPVGPPQPGGQDQRAGDVGGGHPARHPGAAPGQVIHTSRASEPRP